MKFWRKAVLFYLGGGTYMTLEFLWRGRSHSSMFLLGGLCFSLMGRLRKLHLPPAVRMLLGTGMVTALELLTGLAVNRRYTVWDYRNMPFHYRGQICLNYSLLWMLLTLLGMQLHAFFTRRLFGTRD